MKFLILSKYALTTRMPLNKAFRWVQHIQNLTFPHKMSVKISYIFWCLIVGLILWDFGATWCQKARFWEPLGAQLGPKWRPKSPKWRQNGIIFIFTRSPFCRLASEIVFGALLGTISSDFWRILTPFSRNCSIFNQILGINLGHCFARRPELACSFITNI